MPEEKKKKKINYSSAWREAKDIIWNARWRLAVSTQLDTHLPERVLEEQRRVLAERARGVLAVLDNGTDEELGTTHALA